MQVYVFKTEQDVDTYVGQQISTFIQDNDAPVIGFATGFTPLGAYDYLIDSYQSGKTDFSKVRAFNLDEYVGIEKDHPQSFARAMKDYLFSKINIKEENIYSLNGNAKDMTKECKEYDQLIINNPIDIQILLIMNQVVHLIVKVMLLIYTPSQFKVHWIMVLQKLKMFQRKELRKESKRL